MAANNRFEETESIFQSSPFQIEGAVCATECNTLGFLQGLSELKRYLPDCPSGKKKIVACWLSKATEF